MKSDSKEQPTNQKRVQDRILSQFICRDLDEETAHDQRAFSEKMYN